MPNSDHLDSSSNEAALGVTPHFTPGEWRVNAFGETDDGKAICEVLSGPEIVADHMYEPDARLLVAARDLLAAAQAMVDRWDSPDWKDLPKTGRYVNDLRAAIKKALEG